MAEIILIHGYALGLSSPWRRSRSGHGGFSALAKEIFDVRAAVFHWGIDEHVPLKRFFDPFFIKNFYRRERALALSKGTADRLEIFLREANPRVIVCHSMGCFLLLEYLKWFQLPLSVRSVVFVQADVDSNLHLSSPVPITNLYCPWDPTLIFSSFHNGRIRAGLLGLPGAHNRLFPLRLPINLHTSSIRDRRLLNFI